MNDSCGTDNANYHDDEPVKSQVDVAVMRENESSPTGQTPRTEVISPAELPRGLGIGRRGGIRPILRTRVSCHRLLQLRDVPITSAPARSTSRDRIAGGYSCRFDRAGSTPPQLSKLRSVTYLDVTCRRGSPVICRFRLAHRLPPRSPDGGDDRRSRRVVSIEDARAPTS